MPTAWGLEAVPYTVEELADMAQEALTDLKPGVLLKWAALNAHAVGRLAEAQKRVEFMDRGYRENQWRLLAIYPPTAEQREHIEKEGPTSTDLVHWHEHLRSAAAAVRFTEHVMALLERALRQRSDKKNQQQPTRQRPRAA